MRAPSYAAEASPSRLESTRCCALPTQAEHDDVLQRHREQAHEELEEREYEDEEMEL